MEDGVIPLADQMHTPTFMEIGAKKTDGVGAFFSDLFGWKFETMGDGGEGWFETPTMKVGVHGNDPDPGIVPYFKVADIEQAVAKVRELGGSADDNVADEEGFGKFCNCIGPNGIRFGLHQAG